MNERGAMRRRAKGALACLAVTCAIPGGIAQAQDGTTTDRWIVDVSLGKCTLMRTFTEPQAARLAISPEVGTDGYFVEFLKATRKTAGIAVGDGAVRIDGRDQGTEDVTVSDGTAGLPFSISVNTGRKTVDAIGAGSSIAIKSSVGSVGPLPLPDAAKAISALHRCEAEQLIEWGADPAQFAPGGVPPKVGTRRDWVSQGTMGKIHFPQGSIEPLHYLVLSDRGVVERCAAVFGVPNSDFEAVVCKAMMGRKLGEPARDPSGKAVRGVVAFTPAIVRRAIIE